MTTNLADHCRLILAGALLGTLVSGCGLRGDLYLPDDESDTKPAATKSSAAEAPDSAADMIADEKEQESSEAPDSETDDNKDETAITEDDGNDSVATPLP
jgi:predicted small lipoprotein YifL